MGFDRSRSLPSCEPNPALTRGSARAETQRLSSNRAARPQCRTIDDVSLGANATRANEAIPRNPLRILA